MIGAALQLGAVLLLAGGLVVMIRRDRRNAGGNARDGGWGFGDGGGDAGDCGGDGGCD